MTPFCLSKKCALCPPTVPAYWTLNFSPRRTFPLGFTSKSSILVLISPDVQLTLFLYIRAEVAEKPKIQQLLKAVGTKDYGIRIVVRAVNCLLYLTFCIPTRARHCGVTDAALKFVQRLYMTTYRPQITMKLWFVCFYLYWKFWGI